MDPEHLANKTLSSHPIIRPALLPEDFLLARQLFEEYMAPLPRNIGFQNADYELEHLSQVYAWPQGFILLVFVDEHLAGGGAIRPMPDCDYANACEMKHLYIRSAFRRFGLGRRVADELLEGARNLGYACVLLDILEDMDSAWCLFASLGFEEIAPYYFNPLPGVRYLKHDLE